MTSKRQSHRLGQWLMFLGLFAPALGWAQEGSLDPTFDLGSGVKRRAVFRSMADQADGKIVICGEFDAVGGQPFPSIARLDGGSIDGTFRPPWNTSQLPYLSGQIRAVVPLRDGRILMGGSFLANVNGTGDRRYSVACVDTNGAVVTYGFYNTLDATAGVVNTLAVQTDGKILVGGCSLTLNVYPPNTNTYALIRLNADGSPDNTYAWRQGKGGYVQHIDLFTDSAYTNRAVITGVLPADDGSHTDYLLSLTQAGAEIQSLNNLNGAILVTATQSGGQRLLAGCFTAINGTGQNRVARLKSDGAVDTSFKIGAGANAEVRALAIQSDGKILLAGGFTRFDTMPCGRLIRLLTDGTVDASFNPGVAANDGIYDLRLRANGEIFLLGAFTAFNGTARGGIARLASDGTLLASHAGSAAQNSGLGKIKAVAVQPDGKVLIGGDFTEAGGRYLSGIARLNADGSFDATFDPGTGVDGYVQGVALQPDGRVLIAGYFGSANGAARTSLARLNADGSVDESFRPRILKLDGSLSILQTPVLATNGAMLVIGHFRSINGVYRNYIARIQPDGSLDAAFDPQFNILGWDPLKPGVVMVGGSPMVYGAVPLSDGRVLIGGYVTWDGLSRGFLTRLDQSGKLDPTFVPMSVATNVVIAAGTVKRVMSLADGKVLICGDFVQFKDGSWSPPNRGRIARFSADGALDGTFNPPMGADNSIEGMALQSDGKILIAGSFRNYDAVSYPFPTNAVRVARLNPNGALDATFDSKAGPNMTAYSIAWLSTDRAIVAGDFSDYRGVARPGIARIVSTSTPAAPTFASWLQDHFLPTDPASDKTATADPDGDGVINILEYAFGLDPKRSDRTGLPCAGVSRISNQSYLTLTYLRPKPAPADLTYEWRASADLRAWQPSNVIEVGISVPQGDRVAVTVRLATPLGVAPAGFYRLWVSRK